MAPTAYTWELGIEWRASINPLANTSYLPGGFVLPGDPKLIKRPRVTPGDTITFLIFDITEPPLPPNSLQIASFTINPQVGVAGQQSNDPLESYQPQPNPQVAQGASAMSVFFGTPSNLNFPCWQYEAVHVKQDFSDPSSIAKFLLSFFVQVQGPPNGSPGSGLRTFAQDPEMVVGEN